MNERIEELAMAAGVDAKAFKNKLAEIDRLKDRIEKLEAALREIEYLDRPQVRGLPRRIEIYDIARKGLEWEDVNADTFKGFSL